MKNTLILWALTKLGFVSAPLPEQEQDQIAKISAAYPYSFGAHDPYDTKGLCATLLPNNTGTKTEMLYRMQGVFSHLLACHKQYKRHGQELKSDQLMEQESWQQWKHVCSFDEWRADCVAHSMICYNNVLQEKIVTHHDFVSDTNTLQRTDANALLQKKFQDVLQHYKKTGNHTIYPTLLIADLNHDKKDSASIIIAACCHTQGDHAYVSVDYEYNVRPLAYALEAKKRYTRMQQQHTSLVERKFCEMHIRYIDLLLRTMLHDLQAVLFHELSHPATQTITNTIRYKNQEEGTALNEEYTHMLAIFNSPDPLATARRLSKCYHSSRLPTLIKSLEKEGVYCSAENKYLHTQVRVAGYALGKLDRLRDTLTQKGVYNPASGAARFILAEQHIDEQ